MYKIHKTLLLPHSARARLYRLFLFCLHFPMLYKLDYASTTPSNLPFSFHLARVHYYLLSGFRIRYKLETYPKCDLSNLIRCRMLRWNNNFILHTKIAQRAQSSPSLDHIKLWRTDDNKSEKVKKVLIRFFLISLHIYFINFHPWFHQKSETRGKKNSNI